MNLCAENSLHTLIIIIFIWRILRRGRTSSSFIRVNDNLPLSSFHRRWSETCFMTTNIETKLTVGNGTTKSKGTWPPEKPKHSYDNIKINSEIGCELVDYINLDQDKEQHLCHIKVLRNIQVPYEEEDLTRCVSRNGLFFEVNGVVIIELLHQPTLMHSFLYSLTICLLHYYPRHVSSINMSIFRRKNCIHTASGMFALCKRLYSTLSSPLSTSLLCRRLQRAKIPDAVWIQFFLLKMDMLMLETCRG